MNDVSEMGVMRVAPEIDANNRPAMEITEWAALVEGGMTGSIWTRKTKGPMRLREGQKSNSVAPGTFGGK